MRIVCTQGMTKNYVSTGGCRVRYPYLAKPRPKHVLAGSAMRRSGTERAFAPRLVLMVKEAKAGFVKTRLARGVGVVRATSFYRNATGAVLGRLANNPQWETYIAVAPDSAISSPAWPRSTHRFAQGQGDLGQRMQRVFDGLAPGPVVIVGTDVPALHPRHIRQAFGRLGNNAAVFGRAPDGGYWLVGMRRRPNVPRAFKMVRWSSADALGDTLANLKHHKVATLGELVDVDEAGDLQLVSAVEGRRVLPTLTPT